MGRVYQQTLVDTYSKVAAAKLYTEETPITGPNLFQKTVLAEFYRFALRRTIYPALANQHETVCQIQSKLIHIIEMPHSSARTTASCPPPDASRSSRV